MKYKLLIKYLKKLNDNDIVCFVDAYDVLPTKNIIHLEKQFVKFSKKNPKIKMIVGCDIITSKLHQKIFDIVYDNKINAGTYIGYVNNILYILLEIMKKTNISNNDQVELIKYAQNNPNDIFMDDDNDFFFTKMTLLQQLKLVDNAKCSFVHANANGLLEDFLLEHHNINTGVNIRLSNFIEHNISITKKINRYVQYVLKRHVM